MAFHSRTVSFFFSIWMANFMAQRTILLKDIRMSNCRIVGVTLVVDTANINFNFAEAEPVCRQLGLMLAHKSKIEAALKHGFETCSFGWVAEGYVVIPRITPNEKCGKNKTGIAIWRMDVEKKARVYCYNSSDTWINSCIPEESTVSLPESSTEMNSTFTASFQDTSAVVDTTQLQQTQKPPKYRVICVTETLSPDSEPTPEKENLIFTDKRTAFKNEGVPFGAVPIVLLVLALFFCAAAMVLAVCYIKKYKKTSLFSSKEKKDEIETKTLKELNAKNQPPEQSLTNGEKEEVEVKSEPQVKCLEAEV
ncbi:PREDICTED: lymphatic vessel endothelial hyaluronic acid receptor 1 isoform X1 [Thamnophis sirtalis]|uniref:Lymphatic vessel endothelial hyaluronic acid receptor 1 n=1 Tax=Thamnophis sirtalis TaxID=35019 RepID=A0A6I9YVS5_9SAUR|nr:PREDICTED: lymphatic vessel endothelial hyaluronic acid receptor 1 isoform X1 [Thamnophis sirtalis]